MNDKLTNRLMLWGGLLLVAALLWAFYMLHVDRLYQQNCGPRDDDCVQFEGRCP
jgi:hypothetical protein